MLKTEALLFLLFFFWESKEERVYLTPPKIEESRVAERIVCTRPMRKGGARIEAERRGERLYVHCYGHGASGWTTLFGSVQEAIALFEKLRPSKSEPLRVIGGGCIGLTAAIELKRKGYEVVRISAKELFDLPSWKAGGLFEETPPLGLSQAAIRQRRILKESLLTYRAVEEGRHPYLSKTCVKSLPVYLEERFQAHKGFEKMAQMGWIPKGRRVALNFKNGVQREGFIEYQSLYLSTSQLMKELLQEVKRLQIPLIQEEVGQLETLPERLLFNATGSGARSLCQDEALFKATGHLLALSSGADEAPLPYMICTRVEEEGKIERLHFFPKERVVSEAEQEGKSTEGVLGGTFIVDLEKLSPKEQEILHQKEFQKIIERARRFFGGSGT